MSKIIYKTLRTKVYFVNISKKQNNIFSWKSDYSPKHHMFDIKLVNPNIRKKEIFFYINKGDIKIVYIKTKNSLIFSVGADVEVQYQMLEALLESLIEQFLNQFENILLDFGTGSSQLFQKFDSTINKTLNDFHNLNLIHFVHIFCNVCKKSHMLAIKKSLIENSKKTVIPLVYYHEGITLLLYIDKDFNVRGVDVVNLSG